MFVDRVRVNLRAGNGGAGVVSFVRAKGKPKGKPTGGSGGRGGSVYLRANPSVASLLRYQRNPHHSAGHGTHGEGDFRHGKAGRDLVLDVPLGTMVYDDSGTLLADLVEEGQQFEAVKGGRGGRGNAAFVSPSNRAPGIAEQGEYGRSEWFTLELRLLADAALIGFPNAGKSTFISRVSAAKPKIADIPGLIEGASTGKGLGHEFLRHVSRARVLVMLLDPSPMQDRSPAEQLSVLRAEIEAFSPEIASRPSIVLMNKADLGIDASAVSGAFPVSALTGEGLREALHAIADLVDQAEREAPPRKGFILHRPLGPTFTVRREGEAWRVEGLAAERAVAFADLTLPEAADMAAWRLDQLGVDRALVEAGAVAGDEVRIGDISFEFTPERDEEE